MKVFVDTNVWLSGRFRPGLCAELLEALVEEGAEILLDERVLAEFRRIVRDRLGVEASLLARADWFFGQYVMILPGAAQPVPGIPDPDDAWILAAALGAKADWFITGDKALLDRGQVQDLPMLSPREAYLRLRGLS